MRFVIAVALIVAAHFSLTPFAPTSAGKAWFLWPFALDSKPLVVGLGGLPNQSGGVLTSALAGIAGLGFVAALLALFGFLVPAGWWTPLVVVAAVASVLLYLEYFGSLAIIPLALDAVLLWGVLVRHWTVLGLRGLGL